MMSSLLVIKLYIFYKYFVQTTLTPLIEISGSVHIW